MTDEELTLFELSMVDSLIEDAMRNFDRTYPGAGLWRRAFVCAGLRDLVLKDIASGLSGRQFLEWLHRHYGMPADTAAYDDLDDFVESIIKARGRYHAGGN
jgi:hypothetical protein